MVKYQLLKSDVPVLLCLPFLVCLL